MNLDVHRIGNPYVWIGIVTANQGKNIRSSPSFARNWIRRGYFIFRIGQYESSVVGKLPFFTFSFFEVLQPIRDFSLILSLHQYRWRASDFYLYSALMSIEQWGFFCIPHLLWNVTSVYNSHLRGPVTLTLVDDLDSGVVTTCFHGLGL